MKRIILCITFFTSSLLHGMLSHDQNLNLEALMTTFHNFGKPPMKITAVDYDEGSTTDDETSSDENSSADERAWPYARALSQTAKESYKLKCTVSGCTAPILGYQRDAHSRWHAKDEQYKDICHVCQCAFKSWPILKGHLKSKSHRNNLEKNQITQNPLSSLALNNTKATLNIQCTEENCDILLIKNRIKAHKEWHNSTRAYRCDYCKLAFILKQPYERHLASKNHQRIATSFNN